MLTTYDILKIEISLCNQYRISNISNFTFFTFTNLSTVFSHYAQEIA